MRSQYPTIGTGMTVVAQVEQLTIRAGTKPVLDDVELVVAQGSVVALVGSSGGGKTTLLQALIGHVGPGLRRTMGKVAIDGHDPFTLDAGALRRLRRTRVALVGQDPMSQLCPSHRVHDVVGELATAEDRDDAIARALTRAGLPDDEQLLRRRACELSGGQLRRLALARALVRDPALLLLDEPTGGLDALHGRRVATELRALAAGGTTIVLASHDRDHVREVADVVVGIEHGRIAADARRPSRPRSASRPRAATAERLGARSIRALAGGREVVDGVSLSVPAGATLALVGPSGSGKTTLLRYLAGLADGNGDVLLDGRPVARHVRDRRTDDRRAIQYVAQDPLGALNPAHTVAKTLSRPLRRHRGLGRTAATTAAAELLAIVQLPTKLLHSQPTALSGGQRQRVALARALAADPLVLLCDEVTSALDEHTSEHVLQMLRARQHMTGLAVIWATHDLALASRFSDAVLDLDHERAKIDVGARGPRLTGRALDVRS
ncbi:MAG TPA: ATP-binding cassette domain-containing protein [Solirubrobacteraceae bacterium]|jgi:peptide/nickel transport system ATP-binding protein|nr:ATP-binding cassette domain-containing protein [Solirubrobacteraceae bacterium]